MKKPSKQTNKQKLVINPQNNIRELDTRDLTQVIGGCIPRMGDGGGDQ